VSLVVTAAPSWSWLKHRFAASFTTEAAPVNNRSSHHNAAGLPSSSKLELGSPAKKEVILVTGGSGFVGQHVVRLLQEKASNVAEIRVFDTQPYRNKLGRLFAYFLSSSSFSMK